MPLDCRFDSGSNIHDPSLYRVRTAGTQIIICFMTFRVTGPNDARIDTIGIKKSVRIREIFNSNLPTADFEKVNRWST